LAASEAERKTLEAKVSELTAALQARELELQTAAKEVQESTDEIVQTRKQLQGWRQDLEETRVRIQKQKREDIEKLKSVIALAEKVLESSATPVYPDKETGRQEDTKTRGQEDKRTRRQGDDGAVGKRQESRALIIPQGETYLSCCPLVFRSSCPLDLLSWDTGEGKGRPHDQGDGRAAGARPRGGVFAF
jgi:chromosome segregation ATPase